VTTNDDHHHHRHDVFPLQHLPDGGVPQQKDRVSLKPPMTLQRIMEYFQQRPPPEVEDTSVLLYDVILLINLTASISLWVVHRMDVSFIAPAISEGCLLSLLWIVSGLFNGAFLYSAVDGHRQNGGPPAASILAVHTFVNTINLRLLFALGAAILDHRPVGTGLGEDLLSLEMGFGLVLMTVWRGLHSRQKHPYDYCDTTAKAHESRVTRQQLCANNKLKNNSRRMNPRTCIDRHNIVQSVSKMIDEPCCGGRDAQGNPRVRKDEAEAITG
jgi:hypothetical protein